MNTDTKIAKVVEPLKVEVAIEEPMIAEDELRALLKRQGFADVALPRMRDVLALGVYLKGVGVLKMQRGRALISQQRVDDAMRQMGELLNEVMAGKIKGNKVMNATRIVQTLAYASARLTDNQKFLAEMEHHLAPGRGGVMSGHVTSAEPANKGFLPGKEITPGQTLTMREVTLRADHIPAHEINGKKD